MWKLSESILINVYMVGTIEDVVHGQPQCTTGLLAYKIR